MARTLIPERHHLSEMCAAADAMISSTSCTAALALSRAICGLSSVIRSDRSSTVAPDSVRRVTYSAVPRRSSSALPLAPRTSANESDHTSFPAPELFPLSATEAQPSRVYSSFSPSANLMISLCFDRANLQPYQISVVPQRPRPRTPPAPSVVYSTLRAMKRFHRHVDALEIMFCVSLTELIMAEMIRSQFVAQCLKYSPPRVRIDLHVLRCPLIYRFEVFPSNDSTGV